MKMVVTLSGRCFACFACLREVSVLCRGVPRVAYAFGKSVSHRNAKVDEKITIMITSRIYGP